jgi:hypothetical protein
VIIEDPDVDQRERFLANLTLNVILEEKGITMSELIGKLGVER